MTNIISIESGRVASAIKNRLAREASDICAYWVQVTGDRERYAEQLRESLADVPVVVFVVRDVSFNNPNSVLADLVNLLNQNIEECKRVMPKVRTGFRFGIVLISRTALSIPQASSPVMLPDWFGPCGGEIVSSVIEDLTWTAESLINSPEVGVDEICDSLFTCEAQALRKLKASHSSNHNCGNAFMEIIRRVDGERYSELLVAFDAYHASISSPSAFRPSLKEGKSLIGRLWAIVQETNSDGLNRPSKALADALGLPNEMDYAWQESFMAVLSRPSNRDAVPSRRFARSLLTSVAASCQFVTAAAHAGEYSMYPTPLLISFSYELRRSLLESERILTIY